MAIKSKKKVQSKQKKSKLSEKNTDDYTNQKSLQLIENEGPNECVVINMAKIKNAINNTTKSNTEYEILSDIMTDNSPLSKMTPTFDEIDPITSEITTSRFKTYEKSIDYGNKKTYYKKIIEFILRIKEIISEFLSKKVYPGVKNVSKKIKDGYKFSINKIMHFLKNYRIPSFFNRQRKPNDFNFYIYLPYGCNPFNFKGNYMHVIKCNSNDKTTNNFTIEDLNKGSNKNPNCFSISFDEVINPTINLNLVINIQSPKCIHENTSDIKPQEISTKDLNENKPISEYSIETTEETISTGGYSAGRFNEIASKSDAGTNNYISYINSQVNDVNSVENEHSLGGYNQEYNYSKENCKMVNRIVCVNINKGYMPRKTSDVECDGEKVNRNEGDKSEYEQQRSETKIKTKVRDVSSESKHSEDNEGKIDDNVMDEELSKENAKENKLKEVETIEEYGFSGIVAKRKRTSGTRLGKCGYKTDSGDLISHTISEPIVTTKDNGGVLNENLDKSIKNHATISKCVSLSAIEQADTTTVTKNGISNSAKEKKNIHNILKNDTESPKCNDTINVVDQCSIKEKCIQGTHDISSCNLSDEKITNLENFNDNISNKFKISEISQSENICITDTNVIDNQSNAHTRDEVHTFESILIDEIELNSGTNNHQISTDIPPLELPPINTVESSLNTCKSFKNFNEQLTSTNVNIIPSVETEIDSRLQCAEEFHASDNNIIDYAKSDEGKGNCKVNDNTNEDGPETNKDAKSCNVQGKGDCDKVNQKASNDGPEISEKSINQAHNNADNNEISNAPVYYNAMTQKYYNDSLNVTPSQQLHIGYFHPLFKLQGPVFRHGKLCVLVSNSYEDVYFDAPVIDFGITLSPTISDKAYNSDTCSKGIAKDNSGVIYYTISGPCFINKIPKGIATSLDGLVTYFDLPILPSHYWYYDNLNPRSSLTYDENGIALELSNIQISNLTLFNGIHSVAALCINDILNRFDEIPSVDQNCLKNILGTKEIDPHVVLDVPTKYYDSVKFNDMDCSFHPYYHKETYIKVRVQEILNGGFDPEKLDLNSEEFARFISFNGIVRRKIKMSSPVYDYSPLKYNLVLETNIFGESRMKISPNLQSPKKEEYTCADAILENEVEDGYVNIPTGYMPFTYTDYFNHKICIPKQIVHREIHPSNLNYTDDSNHFINTTTQIQQSIDLTNPTSTQSNINTNRVVSLGDCTGLPSLFSSSGPSSIAKFKGKTFDKNVAETQEELNSNQVDRDKSINNSNVDEFENSTKQEQKDSYMCRVLKRSCPFLSIVKPSDFVDPSYFLKAYGDPLCDIKTKKSASEAVETDNGNPLVGKDGNWKCQSCNNVNFPRRNKCNKCSTNRSAEGDKIVLQYVNRVHNELIKRVIMSKHRNNARRRQARHMRLIKEQS